jgi:hypothetical protein
MMSKLCAMLASMPSCIVWQASAAAFWPLARRLAPVAGISLARVLESALANRVTSQPMPTSSSVR